MGSNVGMRMEHPGAGLAGIQCDFSHLEKTSLPNARLLRHYIALDWRVRPLLLFVKFWARQRNVNNALEGTLNSFGFCLMVIHYLQACSPPVLPVLPPLDDATILHLEQEQEQHKEKEEDVQVEAAAGMSAPTSAHTVVAVASLSSSAAAAAASNYPVETSSSTIALTMKAQQPVTASLSSSASSVVASSSTLLSVPGTADASG